LDIRLGVGAAFPKGHHVITNRGDGDTPLLFTHHTQRVPIEELTTQAL
jgi:hypothetical protein